jgi:hypothetical protein
LCVNRSLFDLSDAPEPSSATAKPYQQNFRQTEQKNTVLVFDAQSPVSAILFLKNLPGPASAFP